MRKTKEQKKWEKENLSFPQRHPNIPLVLSIIALITAMVARFVGTN